MISDDVASELVYLSPPNAEDVEAYAKIRDAGLAQAIVQNTPASADQTAAVRKVREAVMTANAARAWLPQGQTAAPGGK